MISSRTATFLILRAAIYANEKKHIPIISTGIKMVKKVNFTFTLEKPTILKIPPISLAEKTEESIMPSAEPGREIIKKRRANESLNFAPEKPTAFRIPISIRSIAKLFEHINSTTIKEKRMEKI